MSDNREAFLDAIAAKSGRPRHQLAQHPFKPLNDLPDTTMAGHSPAELLALAKQNSEAVHVNFLTATLADLPAALTAYVGKQQPESLVLPTDSRLADYGLTDWAASVTPTPRYWQPEVERATNLKAAEADVAIGCADMLLAESGTITVATTPGQGRAFHFLPTHYLALIPASKIVPRSRQAMTYYDAEIKAGRLQTSNINFITGPSNSGDIEMVLVVGVHGPLDMTYLVITDA